MSRFVCDLKPSGRIHVVSRDGEELFDGCHVVGDTHDIRKQKTLLLKAVAEERFLDFAAIVKQCRGVFWGWVELEDRFLLFTDAWGCARVYLAKLPEQRYVVFQSYRDVQDVLPLETTFKRVATYLIFSYIPGNDTLFRNVHTLSPGVVHQLQNGHWTTYGRYDNYCGQKEEMSLDVAATQFAARIHRAIGRVIEDRVVIPLSGGLDSRALLAAALEYKSASDIHTFTFGMAGSMDYELGNLVARRAGTRHTAYPLTIDDYSLLALHDAAEECFGQMFFCTEAPLRVFKEQAEHNGPLMMGFMGDPQGGARIKPSYAKKTTLHGWRDILFEDHRLNGPEEIIRLFNTPPVGAEQLRQELIDKYMSDLPFEDSADFVQLNDNWDFYNRQRKYIAYCVSKNRRQGLRYVYPFLDPEVTAFSRTIPNRYRVGCLAFRKALVERYPALFGLPTTNFHGGKCRWKKQSRTSKVANSLWFGLRHKLLKGHWDPYINVNYVPFWEHCSDTWEVIRHILAREKDFPFLNFQQIGSDIHRISSHPLYAYKRGPSYGRLMAVINLILAMETLNVRFQEK